MGCSGKAGWFAVALAFSGLPYQAGGAVSAADVPGPYRVVMDVDPTLPDHTIFRPDNRVTGAMRMPVVLWANGGCASAGNAFERYLAPLASMGYLVIASGSPHWTAAGRPAPAGVTPIWPAADDRSNPPQATMKHLFDALDWTQTGNADERYEIDKTRVAVAGQSCGGLQAIKLAGDPRIRTAIILNSGIIRGGIPGPDGKMRPLPAYLPAVKGDLASLHAPMLYIVGGPSDQAYEASLTDLTEIATAPVWHASANTGHGGTYWEPGGGTYAQIMLGWLNWKLKEQAEWAAYFTGENCTLCRKPGWTLRRGAKTIP